MSEHKPPKTDKELAQAIDELFDEIPPPQTPDEVDAIIQEAGYDPDEFATRMQTLVEQASANSPLNWRNQSERLEKERKKLSTSSVTSPLTRSKIIESIQQILSQQPQWATHYRNLDETTDDDLLSWLEELRYLSLEQLDYDEDES